MKKLCIIFLTFLSVLTTKAQSSKEELTLRVQEQYSWLSGKIIENLVDLNISESLLIAIIEGKSFPDGIKNFHSLAVSISEMHDVLYESKLQGKCDAYSYPNPDTKVDCEKEIFVLKNKIKVSINASKIKFTETSYRLMMGYLTAVDGFMTKNSSSYGFSRGWRPKTKELHLIIELSEQAKDIKVVWTPDGKAVVITCPAYLEVNEWDSKIGRGLERGGSK